MSSINLSPSHTTTRYNRLARRTRWASPSDVAPFGTGEVTQDIILAQDATLAFDVEKPFTLRRNYNALFLGGSGSGKSNVLQANLANHLPANLILTDSKGELFRTTVEGYVNDDYDVLCLNTIDLSRSCHFSPFSYITCEEDVEVIATMVFQAIQPNGQRFSDPFWDDTAKLLICALVGVLFQMECDCGVFADGETYTGGSRRFLNFSYLFTLIDHIRFGEENGGDVVSPLDRLITMIERGGTFPDFETGQNVTIQAHPDCVGVKFYRSFRVAANKTLKSILVSLNSYIARIQTPEMMRVFSNDEMHLDELDEGKRIIYFIMSDNDSTFSWIGNLAYKLAVNRTMKKADANPDGRLSRPVLFMCDEFANLGQIPDFERAISIARSRRVGFLIFIQSFDQIDRVYGRSTRQIVLDNCDAIVLLGGGSALETAQFASELCGPKGGNSREALISPSEFSELPRDKCIVKISGAAPMLTTKYDAHTHPNADKFLNLTE